MSTQQPPTQRIVSVILGTFNRPQTLRAALASIRALEGPDLKFEILVGDNGTAPETRNVVQEFGAIYDWTDVRGCPAARNLAMKRATGEFIAFLDDDDVWLPGHIRPHIAFLDAHPDYQAVFGQIITTDEHLTPTSTPWPEELPADGDVFAEMMSGYFPQVGATLVRREMLQKYGLMDESLIGDSDWDWQLRIASNHKIGHVKTPCVLFRQRAKATFDTLQLRRTQYTRKIFMRHALPNQKRWARKIDIVRAYFGAVNTYFTYFMEAAEYRVLRGERLGAAKALLSAASIFPTRAVRQLASMPRHRRTLARVVGLPVRIAVSETSEQIDIALGTDSNFVQHAAVAVASVVRSAPGGRFRFIILHTGINAQSRGMVESVAPDSQFVWTEVGENDLPPFVPHVQFTRASLFRLGLEKLAPADCKRVVYLDADLVVTGDIRELWKIDLKGRALGAVDDENMDSVAFCKRWSLSPSSYFNSGVLLIDMEKVRRDKIFSRAIDVILEHDAKLTWKDQDALNVACHGDWVNVGAEWNVQRTTAIDYSRGRTKLLARRSPKIIHFTGAEKPWLAASYHPWSWLYWRNLRRTPFMRSVQREQGVNQLAQARLWLRCQMRRGSFSTH